jgi:hypothetical protein
MIPPSLVAPDLFRGPPLGQVEAGRLELRPLRQSASWMPDQVRHDEEGQG